MSNSEYHVDKHVFRGDLSPESNEAGDVGRNGRRFNVGRFRNLLSDIATYLTLAVNVLTVATKATVPTPVDATDAATKAYVDTAIGGASITVSEVDGTPTVTDVIEIKFDQVTGFSVTDEGLGVAQVAIDTLPIANGGTGANTAAAARAALDVPSNAQAILDTLIDAKGDLISASAADTPARLAVGTEGQVLAVSSAAATGLAWATGRLVVLQAGAGANLVNLVDTADVAFTLVNCAGAVPAGATSILIGVEPGYTTSPGSQNAMQCNIRGETVNTDIVRPLVIGPPLVGRTMVQALVGFNAGSQKFRYQVVSTDSATANKGLIIDIHGYVI